MGTSGQEEFGLGCIKDVPDERDVMFSELLMAAPEGLTVKKPDSFDRTDEMSPVRNQKNEGTCVGFATVVGLKEWQEKKTGNIVELSPRYVYCNARKLQPHGKDGGTYPRLALKVLQHNGVCTEKCWPYQPHPDDPNKSNYVQPCTAPDDNPCSTADTEAADYKIKTYARLYTLDEIKDSLYIDGPCVLGVIVYYDWFSDSTQKNGIIKFPSEDARAGGHAICVVGYDDNKKLLKFKNSWGIDWGDGGYGYMPYDYFERNLMVAWNATDLIEDPKPLIEIKQAAAAALHAKNITMVNI